ncbi:hypothetical protein [Chromobacterium violaceum]|nr:hypothetical protein [Chromobacterium violaceum]
MMMVWLNSHEWVITLAVVVLGFAALAGYARNHHRSTKRRN